MPTTCNRSGNCDCLGFQTPNRRCCLLSWFREMRGRSAIAWECVDANRVINTFSSRCNHTQIDWQILSDPSPHYGALFDGRSTVQEHRDRFEAIWGKLNTWTDPSSDLTLPKWFSLQLQFLVQDHLGLYHIGGRQVELWYVIGRGLCHPTPLAVKGLAAMPCWHGTAASARSRGGGWYSYSPAPGPRYLLSRLPNQLCTSA